MKRSICILLFFICELSAAQDEKTISLAVTNQNFSMPFHSQTGWHPGIEFGYVFKKNQKPHSLRQHFVQLGWFYHKLFENSFYLKGEYVHGLEIGSWLRIDLIAGLGYMHTFFPGEVYELNQLGEFEKINQTGRSHAIGSGGIGITWQKPERIHPFFRNEVMLETPFANGIPVMIHSFTKLGVYIIF